MVQEELSSTDEPEVSSEQLHVHDLPQLYARPSFDTLSQALDLLKVQPVPFSSSHFDRSKPQFNPQGVPHYLTTIISSSLAWLENDEQRERIWDLTSLRLSERSGRSAMPSMTRSFCVTENVTIELFEPSLTEDKLGLKTWTSSLLLARRLLSLSSHLSPSSTRVLELGSGTGLVGIAAASLWKVDVMLSDLPDIVPNLERNVTSNAHLFAGQNRHVQVRSLDWSDVSDSPQSNGERYPVIIAADPIYSKDHPRMLVDTVKRWLQCDTSARFIVELPLRRSYDKERDDLRTRLKSASLELIDEGTEVGYDDWHGADGRPSEVECWWSIWRPLMQETSSDRNPIQLFSCPSSIRVTRLDVYISPKLGRSVRGLV